MNKPRYKKMMKCKICESISLKFSEAHILNKKYKIDYFQCQNCNFIQTEYPYWLSEAYSQAIASSDEGLIFRNLMLSQVTKNIIDRLFDSEEKFLDFGGGYGLFVRLMRDIKYKFDWQDKYCENLFAQNFKATPNQKYELVTAFELLEHLVNPISDIREILNYSQNILFSTEILPPNNPKPNQWWYYATDEGQHISIYTVKSLQIIAQKFHLNFYTNYSSLHLLTEKKISPAFCEALLKYDAENLRKILRQNRDYLKTFERILGKEEGGGKKEEVNSFNIPTSTPKSQELSDETQFLHQGKGGGINQGVNSFNLPTSTPKSQQISDKTEFLQQQELGGKRKEEISLNLPKSTQKSQELSDETEFFQQQEVEGINQEVNSLNIPTSTPKSQQLVRSKKEISINLSTSTPKSQELSDETEFFQQQEVEGVNQEVNFLNIPKSTQKSQELSDETEFFQQQEPGVRSKKEISINLSTSTQISQELSDETEFFQQQEVEGINQEVNSLNIPTSTPKSQQLSDKTQFLQQQEPGDEKEQVNSLNLPTSTQTSQQLSDKTEFLHQGKGGVRSKKEISINLPTSTQTSQQLSDKTEFLHQGKGGVRSKKEISINLPTSTQTSQQLSDKTEFLHQRKGEEINQGLNSFNLTTSTPKSQQLSDKTEFFQQQEGGGINQELNSLNLPTSTLKSELLSDKTKILYQEKAAVRRKEEMSPKPEKLTEINELLSTPTTPQKLGINIAGFVKGELGIGEGVRATLRAVETTNIPFVINNIISTPHRNSDQTYQKFTQENPHPINLFQVNANEVKTFLKKPTLKQYFTNKYNIGFWAWELPKFPPEWITAFTPFHEIWTYSNYCAESISMVSSIPVIKMMPSISLPIPKISRKELGLPTEKFIFLFIFDFFSRLERKNPLATIAAFKKAFGNSNPDVLLLIKSSNSQKFPRDKSRLINSIGDSPNIKHIDGYLSKEKINALLYHCNCYVSLHRAEGFGLTMAEAMFYGKPVIATGYSSNTEFMNVGNSFLVEYEKVAIADNYGPYKQGDIWANPNIEHCANLMKYVFNNSDQAKKIGLKAAEDIKSLLSPEIMGKKIKTRLEYIAQVTENFTNIPATKLSQSSPSNKFPLVSICIPTYNGENFIRAAINSALSQTYSNLEIIISDDNSTDKTLEIAKTLQLENPQIEFRIICHQNYGLVGNLNFCISQARGKYIKFLFQDDLLEKSCIEEFVKIAEEDSEIGLVFSRRRVILEPGAENNSTCVAAYRGTQDLHKDWSNLKTIQSGKDLLLDPNLMKYRLNKIGEPTTVLIPKTVFEKIGLFDSSLTQVLDIDMWFRIMGNYKIGFVDKPLSQLRIHPRQQTQVNLTSGKNHQDYQRFYQKILENPVYSFLATEVKETVRQKLGFLLKKDFSQLSSLVEQYHRFPVDESVLNNLRRLRRQLAEKLLGLSNEQLKYFYQAEIGEIYKLLFNSGIKNEVLTASEQDFVANLQNNFSAKNLWQNILVFLLYRFAFQLPINYRKAVLPKWIFTDFLNFLFARPLNFQEVGELEKYCEYVKDLIVYLKGNVCSNSNSAVRQSIAAFLADDLDLTVLSCCDFSLPNITIRN
ncbi:MULTISPECIES: glycosyltransferase [unclassified Okeania]|uniref:glycosyltransferase n=1 Tax=unclassified Okeania TaxID=2634635 RepID=UPI0013BB34BD|nr:MULTISPECIES: glycosyltransferase [unclassified Okeania]NET19934.1 glycosyltransferase [Okeania sp. SIO1H5]NET91768.1 glycosyltransferase [Okeania sp. SIO1H2]